MYAVAAVLLAALCFSTTATSQALAGTDATPLAVGSARLLVGGGILAVIALLHRQRAHSHGPAPQAISSGRPAPTWVLLAIGTLGVLCYQPAFFGGAAANGVAIGTVVALGSAPVTTGLIEGLLQRRMPGRQWIAATSLCLLGVTLVSGITTSGNISEIDPAGILLSFGAGVSFSVYTIASKRLFQRSWGTIEVMGSVYGIAAAVSLPILLFAGASWLLTVEGILLALWLGVITTAVGYLLFGWGLKRLDSTVVATLTLAEPVAASLLGIIVLHERLSPVSSLGLAIIIAGLIVLSFSPRRKEHIVDSSEQETGTRAHIPVGHR